MRNEVKPIVFAFLFLPLVLLAQEVRETKTLTGFLRLNAIKVDHQTIKNDLKFFINTKFDKESEEFVWFKGSLKSIFGQTYADLDLKFNAINNSVYIRKDTTYFKVSSSKVENFSLIAHGNERKFEKGFGLEQINTIDLTYSISTTELLRYLLDFERFDELEIVELITNKQQGELTIKMNATLREPVYELVKHLSRRLGIGGVKLKSSDESVNENTFFEVLFDDESFLFLKHNYKKISQTESISLVSHSQSHVFEKNAYYFSKLDHEIIATIFTSRSITNSLAFTGVKKNVPPLGNEKKLVKWLRENFSDH